MRFDDRLLTVLNQSAVDRHDCAVRWRQLVDLVARAGPNSASPAVADALEAIRAEAPQVDEKLRAAAARAVAALPLPLGLLEYFASNRLAVSAPVLAATTLDPGQWAALMNVADEETRKFIETLHPEVKAEPALELTEKLAEPGVETIVTPSLHDVVARIERRRRGRGGSAASNGGVPVPNGSPALFRWECGPSGEIAWVEGVPRGALIGRSIARPKDSAGDRVDQSVVRAFANRAPFRDAALTVAGDGIVSGEWKISGIPAFDSADGRFAGYRGVALREHGTAAADTEPTDLLADPDSLRELVHEIKTPLNAIIGFAEIIEGQYLGPADRSYRDRATEIVAQARLLLTAIDDLDFAAKVHSSMGQERPRIDLGELIERLASSLREHAATRAVELDCSRAMHLIAEVEPELADRLIVRAGTAMIDHAERGERLRLSVDQSNGHCRVSVSRPASLQALSDAELFGAGAAGEGTSLRLARGLARVAGCDLVSMPGAIALVFPRA